MRCIKAGTFGFKIRLKTGTDLTGYTTLKVKIRPPTGDTIEKGASTPDPAGGYIEYVVESDIFPEAGPYGEYEIEGKATFTGKVLKTLTYPLPRVVESL
jgi:hypothetical protein